MYRCLLSFKKIPSNLLVVWVGNISFQKTTTLASPRLYLGIFFQIYGHLCLFDCWQPDSSQTVAENFHSGSLVDSAHTS